ncbi:MAG: WS/DGAT/MGAT family O-acyltransferase, partial [Trebonia sp.]
PTALNSGTGVPHLLAMLVPMSPTDAVFLLVETREHPMHVGGLQLFCPPEGATALDVRDMFTAGLAEDPDEVAPLFRKRARRSVTSLGQWGWEPDPGFDLDYHVRRSALPQPGRVRDLLALCSRLHSSLLDRHRPLWELHLIEGLDDGRFATYFKVHHAMVDGVAALRMLARMLSPDADERGMPPPWAPRQQPRPEPSSAPVPVTATDLIGDVAGLGMSLARTVQRALAEQSGALSFSAPKSMFNVPITGARRFAAQSWPMDRVRAIGKAAEVTVNDVVLALCAGALRSYLARLDALPEAPLIAMVPVSLRSDDGAESEDGGGNAIGAVMCNLGTHLADAGERLTAVHASMTEGKAFLREMSPVQTVAMTALGMSPLVLYPLLRLDGIARPPFNLIISNVPGPREPMYWNGARLNGLYPLSVPLDGQALNITCTSYSNELAFGLTGCRRTVPHLQQLLGDLEDEFVALERAAGMH